MSRVRVALWVGILVAVGTVVPIVTPRLRALDAARPAELDPAAWGTDHVGQDLPEFATGGECLFCHRTEGASWDENHHQRTMRAAEATEPALAALGTAEPELAKEVEILLGAAGRARFLRNTGRYGSVALLPYAWSGAGAVEAPKAAGPDPWNQEKFAEACAGCHASGTDSRSKTFFSVSLDCYTCHGEVIGEHTKNPELVLLNTTGKDDPKVVASICGSCHLRTGRSRASGLPYANNFVPGDNLFRDYAVDLSQAALARLEPGDRHVLESTRDVVIRGKAEAGCLACHDIHKQSTKKHRARAEDDSCVTCHEPGEPKSEPRAYERHSERCEY